MKRKTSKIMDNIKKLVKEERKVKKKLSILDTSKMGRRYRGTKGAKAAFQILAKCCVFIAALFSQYSNEKRKFETPS